MYKLELEYLPYPSLFDYFNNNSLKLDLNNSKETIINDLNTNDMITIYKQIFNIIYEIIKNNIISYDLENINNFLIDKNKQIYVIDYANYCVVKKYFFIKNNSFQKI